MSDIILDYDFVRDRYVTRKEGMPYPRLMNRPSMRDTFGITYTRTLDAYAEDDSGVYYSFAANEPRRTPNKGLLVEEARTNLTLSSLDYAGANWTKTGTSAGALVAGPDGAVSATPITEASASGVLRDAAALTVVSGSTYTVSRIVKRGNFDWFRLVATDSTAATNQARAWFNLATGAVGTATTGGAGWSHAKTPEVQALGGGFYRCTIFVTVGATTLYTFCMSATGDAGTNRADVGSGAGVGTTYTLHNSDVTLGSFPLSPILTTGAAGTRGADTLTLVLPGSNPADLVEITYEGGTVSGFRGILAPGNVLNLGASSGGAWVNKFVQRVTVRKAADGAQLPDAHWANVVYLSGFSGAHGAQTDIQSEDASPKLSSFISSAAITTAQSKFGGSALNNGGGWLNTPSSAAWQFGAGQFTLEGWIWIPSGTSDTAWGIVANWSSTVGNRSWRLYYLRSSSGASKSLGFDLSVNGTDVASSLSTGNIAASLPDNTWIHWAVDRDASNRVRIYVNGVMVASATAAVTAFAGTDSMMIGRAGSDFGVPNSFHDEVRITKGVARYASDAGFTVPTLAYPRS